MDKFLNLNPLILAFVGDAVYTEHVRAFLANNFAGRVNDFHKKASKLVCCEFQAELLDKIFDKLTPDEQALATRARNPKKGTTAHHVGPQIYNKSTALEAVLGYAHLTGNTAKVESIMAEVCTLENIK